MLKRLTELSDAMAAAAIEMGAEVIATQSSLVYMWKKLAYPNPVAAPKMNEAAAKYFDQMTKAAPRLKHGKTQKGRAVYFPVIRCNGSTRAIYSSMAEEKGPKFPEIASRTARQRYSESAARWKILQSCAIICPSNTSPILIFTPIAIEFWKILKFL